MCCPDQFREQNARYRVFIYILNAFTKYVFETMFTNVSDERLTSNQRALQSGATQLSLLSSVSTAIYKCQWFVTSKDESMFIQRNFVFSCASISEKVVI